MCGGRLGLAGYAPGGADPQSGAGLLERGLDQVGRGRGGAHLLVLAQFSLSKALNEN